MGVRKVRRASSLTPGIITVDHPVPGCNIILRSPSNRTARGTSPWRKAEFGVHRGRPLQIVVEASTAGREQRHFQREPRRPSAARIARAIAGVDGTGVARGLSETRIRQNGVRTADQTTTRLAGLTPRLAGLATRLAGLATRLAGLTTRLAGLTTRLAGLTPRPLCKEARPRGRSENTGYVAASTTCSPGTLMAVIFTCVCF